MRVAVDFELQRVGIVELDPDGKLAFPQLPAEPGIYQFRLLQVPGSSVYIGESDDLRRRLTGYRNPGPTQRTNIRMNDRLRAHLEAEQAVEVSMATEALIELDGVFAPLDLRRRASRLLVENAALIMAAASGADEIENL